MKILLEENKIAAFALGKQVYHKDLEYRLMKYCVRREFESETVLFNMMTKEMVALTSTHVDEKERSYLIERWFYVPVDYQEERKILKLREIMRSLEQQKKGMTHYTILPTTECNARCYYCYEKGKVQTRMSDEVAASVADYIRQTCAGKFSICWFGGEPLLNANAIDIIVNRISDLNFQSQMISNGYLMDENNLAKAILSWRLDEIQITLDGTERTYNRIKNYVYEESPNPFRQVIHHIHMLLDAKVNVIVRMNLGQQNYQDLQDLICFLSSEFGTNSYLSIYANVLYQHLSDEHLHQQYIQLTNLLKELYFMKPHILKDLTIKHCQCQADSPHSMLITPDGNLSRCEHMYDVDICGNVRDGITNSDVISQWNKYIPYQPKCYECILFPNCIRLKRCELNLTKDSHCSVFRKENKLQELIKAVDETYKGIEDYKKGNLGTVTKIIRHLDG